MRSLRERLDRLAQELGLGLLWEGHTNISRHGLFKRESLKRAPDSVRRAAICMGAVVATTIIFRGGKRAASIPERLGLAGNDGPDVIQARLIEVAREAGFT